MVAQVIQNEELRMRVVPNDWYYLDLDELIYDFRGGAPLEPSDFTDSGVKVLPKSGVTRGGVLRINPDDQQYCSEEYAEDHQSSLVDKSYTVIVLRDLVPSGPNIGLMVKIDSDENYLLAQGVYGFKVKSDKVVPEYLVQLSNSHEYRKLMKSILVGSTQVHITNTTIKNIKIPLPPTLNEQSAIVHVLSDTDNLIESLDRLIEKKRNIKQGAMQELLTGKKRLPGFNDEWETKRFGDILDYEQPVNYLVKSSEYSDNYETPVLTANKSFILGYTNEKEGIYNNIPAIIFDDFTTDSKFVKSPFKVKSSAIKILKAKDNFDLRFIFEKMQLVKFPVGYHKRYYISEYQNQEIIMPENPREQFAVSQFLSEMDSEIELLEQEMDKYKQLKIGMMQQLLTGSIRLKWKS